MVDEKRRFPGITFRDNCTTSFYIKDFANKIVKGLDPMPFKSGMAAR
jgi:hypothetical protein